MANNQSIANCHKIKTQQNRNSRPKTATPGSLPNWDTNKRATDNKYFCIML